MANVFFYDTTIGKLGIAEENSKIIGILFKDERYDNTWVERETPTTKKAYTQITEYISGKRKKFDLTTHYSSASSFFSKVMDILKTIPYGETITYKDIARRLNNPKAYRAVGMVCNRNPLPIIVPCHRVISTSGALIGYRGGVEIKKKLLELERSLN